MNHLDFRQALDTLERSGAQAILSASFDLRPGASGRETATAILREAIKADPIASDRGEQAVDDLATMLTETLDGAVEAGAGGLFVAGPLDDPTRLRMETAVAPRHAFEVGPRAGGFELERYAALVRPAVASVWVDRSRMLAVLTSGDDEPVTAELESDTHFMQDTTGRTGMHDRGGSVAMPAGGHGKTRIERSAEEERERFAREVAARLGQQLDAAEIILMHGPPEFEARVLAELPPRLRERIADHPTIDHPPTPGELAAEARSRAVDAQFERAETLCRAIASGELGDRTLRGPGALLTAAQQGRVESIVVDEDAVGHLGDAMDARVHAPSQDVGRIRQLLDAARGSAATSWFARSDVMDDGVGGAVGTLRW